MALGKVEQYLRDEIKKHGTICLPLIDSENSSDAAAIAKKVEENGASAILVGGSSITDQLELAKVVAETKARIKVPVILFPGNVTGVSPKADAILFSSLLNSENPYFITEAQALAAISVKKYGIEPLPTAYIIVGEGTAAWFIGRARGIPYHKPKIAVMYSLAAQYMGIWRYKKCQWVKVPGENRRIPRPRDASEVLEQRRPDLRIIEPETWRAVRAKMAAVRKQYEGTLIVGGGIRSPDTAAQIAKAGADIIVIGTMIEKDGNWQEKFLSIVKAIRAR